MRRAIVVWFVEVHHPMTHQTRRGPEGVRLRGVPIQLDLTLSPLGPDVLSHLEDANRGLVADEAEVDLPLPAPDVVRLGTQSRQLGEPFGRGTFVVSHLAPASLL